MTALLVAVTFVALGLAGALLFYALRLTREQRDRSEARALALSEMAGDEPPAAVDAAVAPPAPLVARSMFGAEDGEAGASRAHTLAAPALGLILVLLALGGLWHWTRGGAASASGPEVAPLELLSLTHQRSGASLLVSGLVRNPPAGRAADGLAAVVFAFDGKGGYLASGRASLDLARLSPGDESGFSIALPRADGVARYRVSFRTDQAVVPHVDRRDPDTPGRGGPR